MCWPVPDAISSTVGSGGRSRRSPCRMGSLLRSDAGEVGRSATCVSAVWSVRWSWCERLDGQGEAATLITQQRADIDDLPGDLLVFLVTYGDHDAVLGAAVRVVRLQVALDLPRDALRLRGERGGVGAETQVMLAAWQTIALSRIVALQCGQTRVLPSCPGRAAIMRRCYGP